MSTKSKTQPDGSKKRQFRTRVVINLMRYSLMNLFLLGGILSFALGGIWMWAGLGLSFILVGFVEELIGDAGDENAMPPTWYLNAMLYATLPLLVFMTLVILNTSTANGIGFLDPLVFAVGIDPVNARHNTQFWSISGGFASLGMYYGYAGVNVAHELVHRTNSKFDMIFGRWLLSFTWDTGFSIEHVYGHHRNVGTPADPATARRGEYVLFFVVRSAVGQWFSALAHENRRLARKGLARQIWRNRFWRGQLMTLTVIAGYVWLAGPIGFVWVVFVGAIGKVYFEIVNYVEHYGLVRIPGSKVEARHSWDSYRWFSTGMFYNLPLHSNHHRFATKPFWKLEKAPQDAPVLRFGYMPMILMSFLPPLWKFVSTPLLADWDRRLASPEERALLKSQGRYLG
ncbi:MAG: alkane 1-monooxygenase [Alphaproteobacteria bacterium]|nr:alkane 1-monooxygenase [Alphaproteobacteria bacterium]